MKSSPWCCASSDRARCSPRTFREVAGRSLLLPRRRAGQRTALWQQRKRAADLLAVAARYGSFPAVLETYRECLRDVFDMPALTDTLHQARTAFDARGRRPTRRSRRRSRPRCCSTTSRRSSMTATRHSPSAARRRCRGSRATARTARRRGTARASRPRCPRRPGATAAGLEDGYRARTVDGVHDLLLRIGDLSPSRADPATRRAVALAAPQVSCWRRAAPWTCPWQAERLVAVEDAVRYRDALGTPLPPGLPAALLEPVADSLGDSDPALRTDARAVHLGHVRGTLRPRACTWSSARWLGWRPPAGLCRANSGQAAQDANGAAVTCS